MSRGSETVSDPWRSCERTHLGRQAVGLNIHLRRVFTSADDKTVAMGRPKLVDDFGVGGG